ncbi:DUF6892 domain-containing protein [Streptomyces bobili]|uniref:DUF6892 domain-containing protein n=1 Tax=Streptomyces bobili TaxID=67280 RepID=UPI0037F8601A
MRSEDLLDGAPEVTAPEAALKKGQSHTMLNHSPLPETLDKNLRLAILEELMVKGILPRPDETAFAAEECDDCATEGGGCECDCGCGQNCVCGSEVDCDPECGCGCECADQDYRYRYGVATELLNTPVTTDQCSTVRDLRWGAGDDHIISAIWTYWDGESHEFDIESLEGIAAAIPALESLSIGLCAVRDLNPLAACTSLQRLSLRGGGAALDLGPLAGLRSLRTLDLEYYQDVQDLRPLTELPLERLTLEGNPDVDLAPLEDIASLRTLNLRRMVYTVGSEPPILSTYDNARVIEVVKQRGVAVTVR